MLPAQNYANDVVCALRDVCLERGIPMPTIVTESGRALASHHAVMVFDVVARSAPSQNDPFTTWHGSSVPQRVLCLLTDSLLSYHPSPQCFLKVTVGLY